MNEKEFAIIKEISQNFSIDQREISHNTGLSLGLTNLIIKRLIKKGFIKVKQLNGRKINYILTSKGFKEKVKKSYNYTIKTIKLFKEIKIKIQELILNFQKQGIKKFIIIGNNELTDLTEFAFETFPDVKNFKYYFIRDVHLINKLKKEEKVVIFYTETKDSINKLKQENQSNIVYLLDFLSESRIFL